MQILPSKYKSKSSVLGKKFHANIHFSLTDAAADRLSNFKERSATGIQYMIEKHSRLEVNISIEPNYVIVPYGGIYIE